MTPYRKQAEGSRVPTTEAWLWQKGPFRWAQTDNSDLGVILGHSWFRVTTGCPEGGRRVRGKKTGRYHTAESGEGERGHKPRGMEPLDAVPVGGSSFLRLEFPGQRPPCPGCFCEVSPPGLFILSPRYFQPGPCLPDRCLKWKSLLFVCMYVRMYVCMYVCLSLLHS